MLGFQGLKDHVRSSRWSTLMVQGTHDTNSLVQHATTIIPELPPLNLACQQLSFPEFSSKDTPRPDGMHDSFPVPQTCVKSKVVDTPCVEQIHGVRASIVPLSTHLTVAVNNVKFNRSHQAQSVTMDGSHPSRTASDSSRISQTRSINHSSPLSQPSSRSSIEDDLDERPSWGCELPKTPIVSLRLMSTTVSHTRRKLSVDSTSSGCAEISGGSTVAAYQRNKPLPPRPATLRTLIQDDSRKPSNKSALPKGSRLPKLKKGPHFSDQLEPNNTDRGSQPLSRLIMSDLLTPSKRRHDSYSDTQLDDDNFQQQRNTVHNGVARNRRVTPDDAENIVLKVLSNASCMADLSSMALVNKGFYRLFRRYEKDLVSKALYSSSPPAWELRQIMRHEEKRVVLSLKSFNRDIATIRALQSFILMNCQSSCRSTTLNGLFGNDNHRLAEIDDALWRIWIFCKLFGNNRSHASLRSQVRWLQGSGRCQIRGKPVVVGMGNKNGLSTSQLEDVSEMWDCLEQLMSGFKGREFEAKKAGIFDNCALNDEYTERDLLHAWIQDVLSLGPKAVLTLSSCSFEQAKILGMTRWKVPSRGKIQSNFLKSAVEEVYREKLVTQAQEKAAEFAKIIRSQSCQKKPIETREVAVIPPAPAELAVSPLLLRSQSVQAPSRQNNTTSPIQGVYEMSDSSLNGDQQKSQSISTTLGMFSSLAVTTRASTRLGATLFPISDPPNHSRAVSTASTVSLGAEEAESISTPVLDPADKALKVLVDRMGIPKATATRALASSDNGSGVDMQRAVEYLNADMIGPAKPLTSVIHELPSMPIQSAPPASTNMFHKFKRGSRDNFLSRSRSQRGTILKRSRKGSVLDVIPDTEDDENNAKQISKADNAISPVKATFTELGLNLHFPQPRTASEISRAIEDSRTADSAMITALPNLGSVVSDSEGDQGGSIMSRPRPPLGQIGAWQRFTQGIASRDHLR